MPALVAERIARAGGALAAALSALALAACAGSQPAAPAKTSPEGQRQAHLACTQQMWAAQAGMRGTTPNRHQYLMCMKAKGYD
jgi:uncharacterized lipoprotein YbaY